MKNPLDLFREGAKTRDAYRNVFSTPDGKRVLAHLAKITGVTNPTYTPDARLAAYKEGRRELWHQISKTINTDESALLAEIERIHANEQDL